MNVVCFYHFFKQIMTPKKITSTKVAVPCWVLVKKPLFFNFNIFIKLNLII